MHTRARTVSTTPAPKRELTGLKVSNTSRGKNGRNRVENEREIPRRKRNFRKDVTELLERGGQKLLRVKDQLRGAEGGVKGNARPSQDIKGNSSSPELPRRDQLCRLDVVVNLAVARG